MMAMGSIAIVGGGIGGLTAALALLRRGIDVTVHEQTAELREIGAGVQTTPNGTRVLLDLALQDGMDRFGTQTSGKQIHLWSTGQTWQFQQLGQKAADRYGVPYLTFHRADLHGLLLEAVRRLKPDAVQLSRKFSRFVATDDGVTLHFEDGSSAQASLLVGADGVHSRVREQLFGPAPTRFTGVYAWRGLIPASQLDAHFNLSGGGMWLGTDAHIITYPVRKGALLNFVGLVDSDGWQKESWSELGSPAECLTDFAGWHADVQQMVRSMSVLYKWALVVREPMTAWSRGRVTLLGDACHPTLPFLSQGANMAMEDGLVLARCLAADRADPQAALQCYEQARIARTSRIVRSSAEQVRRVHAPQLATPETAAPYIESQWAANAVEDRYDWIWSYDARTVALNGRDTDHATDPGAGHGADH